MNISSSNIVKNKAYMPCVKLDNIKNFDVNKIFDCGQCFRFDRVENSEHEKEFSGVAFGRFVSFAQDGDSLYIYNSTEEDIELIWKHYLALDIDYDEIRRDILSRSDNPDLYRAIEYGEGIRILNQEPWEAVCSFIISQNNNIPRIKKIIEALSQKCGTQIELPRGYEKHLSGKSSMCSFPTPEAILALGVDGLFELKTGFRAKYIYDAAMKTQSGGLCYDKVFNADTEDAIDMLCEVKGIGPKVASCALLFAFEKYDAFPIDVWIKKVIEKYFSGTNEKFDPKMLGDYAGIAQQYLFYYERYLMNKS